MLLIGGTTPELVNHSALVGPSVHLQLFIAQAAEQHLHRISRQVERIETPVGKGFAASLCREIRMKVQFGRDQFEPVVHRLERLDGQKLPAAVLSNDIGDGLELGHAGGHFGFDAVFDEPHFPTIPRRWAVL